MTTEPPVESDWERRRRLAAVFGDVLPETTSDERSDRPAGAGAGTAEDPDAEDPNDAWLRAQVPPHHG